MTLKTPIFFINTLDIFGQKCSIEMTVLNWVIMMTPWYSLMDMDGRRRVVYQNKREYTSELTIEGK